MKHEGRIRMILDGPEKGLWVAYCTGCDFETPPRSIEPGLSDAADEHARAANLDEGATITTLSVEDRGRLYELAAEVAYLVCVHDVTHVDDRARRRRLDLAANELGYLLGLPEPEFRELWRGPSEISDREALLQLTEEEPQLLHMPPTPEERKRRQIWRVRREEALAVAEAIRRGER